MTGHSREQRRPTLGREVWDRCFPRSTAPGTRAGLPCSNRRDRRRASRAGTIGAVTVFVERADLRRARNDGSANGATESSGQDPGANSTSHQASYPNKGPSTTRSERRCRAGAADELIGKSVLRDHLKPQYPLAVHDPATHSMSSSTTSIRANALVNLRAKRALQSTTTTTTGRGHRLRTSPAVLW